MLARDTENSYLASDTVDEDPLDQLRGHSITYRIAVGPQTGRKVFTLQTLPACDSEDPFGDTGKVAGFSLHAGVAAKAHERKKRERLWKNATGAMQKMGVHANRIDQIVKADKPELLAELVRELQGET